ncbi:MAG: transposase [Bacteroidaceae bacterium]|nr:transposase [Bacteroidaceae bacterium]
MPTITRKIELTLCTEGLSDEQRKAQWGLLFHINDNLYKAANNVSSKLYLDEHVQSMVRMKHDEYLGLLKELARAEKQKMPDAAVIAELREKIAAAEKEMTDQELAICKYATEMPTQSLSYRLVTEIETNIFAQILDCLKQNVFATFNSDARDVKRGERAIRNYKKGMPIPFPWNKAIKIESQGDDFFLRWYSGIRFKFVFGKDRSNNRAIVMRCLKLDEDYDGEYKLCNSSIQMVKRDGGMKLFLLLVVSIPQEHVELNKKIAVGVDLGVNVPAYVATNITEERKAIGDREHFLNTRMQFQRRYKSLQRLKTTAGGKGRTKKLEPLERLRDAERNWVHTQNHLFSREVVNFAVQTHAATIHLEDLSGFGKDYDGNADERKEFVLRNWSYYELQNMITYKAAKYGIHVVKVRPAFTSRTCSCCGQQGFREGVTFICENPECKQYGEKVHADYNAARNIANSNDIIQDNHE